MGWDEMEMWLYDLRLGFSEGGEGGVGDWMLQVQVRIQFSP